MLARILQNAGEWTEKLARSYACALRRGLLRPGTEPDLLALESQSFMFGLVRLWLMDTEGAGLRNRAREMVHVHVELRRA